MSIVMTIPKPSCLVGAMSLSTVQECITKHSVYSVVAIVCSAAVPHFSPPSSGPPWLRKSEVLRAIPECDGLLVQWLCWRVFLPLFIPFLDTRRAPRTIGARLQDMLPL